jgi:hypothetical protein
VISISISISKMRRLIPEVRPAVAYLLLAVFSSILLLPLLSAGAAHAAWAACCKDTGKHFCLAPSGLKSTDALPRRQRISERCAYAFAPALTGIVPTYTPTAASAAHSGSIQQALAQTCASSLPFLPARDTNLKRGPPSFSANLFA